MLVVLAAFVATLAAAAEGLCPNGVCTVGSSAASDFHITGSHDEIAIQGAIDTPGASRVVLGHGDTFRVEAPVTLKSGVSIYGDGSQLVTLTTLSSVFTTGYSAFSAATVALAADAASRATTLALATDGGVAVGDHVKVFDDRRIGSTDQGTRPFFNGEIARVTAVSGDGKNLTIERPLFDDYLVARAAGIRIMRMLRDVNVDGVNFRGPGMETESLGWMLAGVRDSRITACTFEDFGNRAVQLWDTLNVTVSHSTFRRVFLAGHGYSVAITNACDDVHIENNNFEVKGRHYIATGAGTGDVISGGMIRRIWIVNNVFDNSTDEAVNTHDPCRGFLVIRGNSFVNCVKGIELSNADSVIEDNIFLHCGNAIETYDFGLTTHSLVQRNAFAGNTRSAVFRSAATFVDNELDNGGWMNLYSANRIVVARNTFKNYIEQAIYTGETQSPNKNFVITGNKFNCTGATATPMVQFVYADGVVVSDNLFGNCGGVMMSNGSNIVVSGNVMTSPVIGVRIFDAVGPIFVTGNTVGTCSRGVSLERYGDTGTISSPICVSGNNITAKTVVIYNEAGAYTNVSTCTIHRLTVTGGSGSGMFSPGSSAVAVANRPPDGQHFASWTGDTSPLSKATAATVVFTMPDSDMTIVATFSSTTTSDSSQGSSCSCTVAGPCCDGCHYADSLLVCRPSTGSCDPAEKCTGSSSQCPADTNTCPDSSSSKLASEAPIAFPARSVFLPATFAVLLLYGTL